MLCIVYLLYYVNKHQEKNIHNTDQLTLQNYYNLYGIQ